MYPCEKCKELIGEDKKECPFCKHISSREYMQKQKELSEKVHDEAVENAMKQYQKNVKRTVGLFVLLLALLGVGSYFILRLGFDENVYLGYVIAICVGNIILSFVLKLNLCPYCERPMGRMSMLRDNCPRCGGRLR